MQVLVWSGEGLVLEYGSVVEREEASAGRMDVVGRPVRGGGRRSCLGLTSRRATEALQEGKTQRQLPRRSQPLLGGFG